MSVFLIFKKRTTKADRMSGHILALRVIHFKNAMENLLLFIEINLYEYCEELDTACFPGIIYTNTLRHKCSTQEP